MQVTATLTTRLTDKGLYHHFPVAKVERYQIESAIDTDADPWSVDIGDPHGDWMELFNRNNEVRVNLNGGVGGANATQLQTGFADQLQMTEEGILSLSGRDISAPAIDSDALPYDYVHARPDKIVEKQARELGIGSFKLAPISPFPKLFTDGSEKVWEFWYRMYRKRDMWLWVEADGRLVGDQLNYNDKPRYNFGTPPASSGSPNSWIPVSAIEIRKNTQTRLGEVWVYGESGNNPLYDHVVDPDVQHWIKKPIKILQDQAITGLKGARKAALEELFEGKVGELEIVVTVSTLDQIIRVNEIAHVSIPTLQFEGDWYIVGNILAGGPDGFTQQVRLREKVFAISRRKPKDPKLPTHRQTSQATFGVDINIPSGHNDWGKYFVLAAREFSGLFDENLFLAALLAICDRETGGAFANVRESSPNAPSGIEWFPFDDAGKERLKGEILKQLGKPIQVTNEMMKNRYDSYFANSGNNVANPFNARANAAGEAGVGPMQLTYRTLKEDADKLAGTGVDEYQGGRWSPQWNIWVGAKLLHDNAQGLQGTDNDLWLAAQRYHSGSGDTIGEYGKDIRKRVKDTWLAKVKSAAAASAHATSSIKTDWDYSLSGVDPPDTIRKIISFAELQKGRAYTHSSDSKVRTGRTQPPTYDCSGLVWRCYDAAGLSDDIGGLGSTFFYFNKGKTHGSLVSIKHKDKLLPGDMVFFDNHLGGDQPGHMGVYYHDGIMIVASSSNNQGVVEQSVSTGGLTFMGGMRLAGIWDADQASSGSGATSTTFNRGGKIKKVLIQAGHEYPEEPGFVGQTGAASYPGLNYPEIKMSAELADNIKGRLEGDNRFAVTRAPGQLPTPNWVGDLAFFIHGDGSGSSVVTGYSFGYPTTTQAASIVFRDAIINHYKKISGAPGANPAGDNYTADESGYYGFGRTSATAKLLMEMGFMSNQGDATFIKNHVPQIGLAIYHAICDYFGLNYQGG